MSDDVKTRFFHDFSCQISQAAQVRIDDSLALSANHVGMREWFAAVVAVAPIGKPQLEDLAQLLQERDGLVDGCKTGGGKVGSHFFVDHLGGGVSRTRGQNPENSESLWRDAKILASKPFEHLIQSCFYFRIMILFHHVVFFLNSGTLFINIIFKDSLFYPTSQLQKRRVLSCSWKAPP